MLKKTGFFLVVLALGTALPPAWCASSPAASTGEEDKPFKPYWENEIGFSSANQQAGQSTNTLSYTGTQHFTEGGDFISVEVSSARQKIEGDFSSTGTFTTEGGLGLGFFSPSLSVGAELGDHVYRQLDANLTLDFQLWDFLALDYTLGGNVGNHQGDVTSFFPQLSALTGGQPVTEQIDTAGWSTSLGPSFTPWDWWTISTTLGYEYDITYQVQTLVTKKKVPVNQADQVATLTLGLDFTLFKGFVLDLSPQVGREYSPAGGFYSNLAGGFVQFSTPTTQNFVGGTLSVSYSFE